MSLISKNYLYCSQINLSYGSPLNLLLCVDSVWFQFLDNVQNGAFFYRDGFPYLITLHPPHRPLPLWPALLLPRPLHPPPPAGGAGGVLPVEPPQAPAHHQPHGRWHRDDGRGPALHGCHLHRAGCCQGGLPGQAQQQAGEGGDRGLESGGRGLESGGRS